MVLQGSLWASPLGVPTGPKDSEELRAGLGWRSARHLRLRFGLVLGLDFRLGPRLGLRPGLGWIWLFLAGFGLVWLDLGWLLA